MNLHELQRAFSDTLFNPDDKQILPSIGGQSDDAKNRRLDIYRNNVFHSLSEALAELFPVIKRLVGKQFFNATAREYIRQRPPRSAAMVHFGGDFPDFLRTFEYTVPLVYLADVARIELARHHAYHAEDGAVLSAADFAAVTPEQLGRAQLALHASVVLLESNYPVFQIWNANQDDNPIDDLIDLDDGGVHLSVYRPCEEVYVQELDGATYALLTALQQSESLASALSRAGESESASTIPEIFSFCIQEGFFTKIIES